MGPGSRAWRRSAGASGAGMTAERQPSILTQYLRGRARLRVGASLAVIGVQAPIAHVLQAFEPLLGDTDRLFTAFRLADDDALQNLERVAVGAHQILEELDLI